MFRWAFLTQVTPRFGLPQPSVYWASSLLWLRCRCPQSAPVSTAPPPPSYAIWPGYNHRQKGCWLVTEILKQYIYLSGEFFFVSTKETPETNSGLWWPVLSSPVTKMGHSTSGNMIYLMWIYYPAKKVIERGKAGDFQGKSFFLSAILTLPKWSPHLLYIAFGKMDRLSFTELYSLKKIKNALRQDVLSNLL